MEEDVTGKKEKKSRFKVFHIRETIIFVLKKKEILEIVKLGGHRMSLISIRDDLFYVLSFFPKKEKLFKGDIS